MMNLDHLSGLVIVDAPRRRARSLAGTRLRDVPALLAPQSLAGVTSTDTHGTGLAFTGFAGAVTGLTLVSPDIDSLRLPEEQRPEIFGLARLSLGALGVVTEVEFQCVPAFALLADEQGMPLDAILEAPVFAFLGSVSLVAGVLSFLLYLINLGIEWLETLVRDQRAKFCGQGLPSLPDWEARVLPPRNPLRGRSVTPLCRTSNRFSRSWPPGPAPRRNSTPLTTMTTW